MCVCEREIERRGRREGGREREREDGRGGRERWREGGRERSLSQNQALRWWLIKYLILGQKSERENTVSERERGSEEVSE